MPGYPPDPSEWQRSELSALFGRRHGIPTERPVKATRASDIVRSRRRVEAIAERRRLRDAIDWYD